MKCSDKKLTAYHCLLIRIVLSVCILELGVNMSPPHCRQLAAGANAGLADH